MTTPTNNPIPSESPKDLAFNAGKVDEFVNSADEAFADRFGIARLTLTGIQAEADNVILSLGFIPVDSFEAGATISSRNQALHYLADNNYYRWDGSLTSAKVVPSGSTPSSSGGIAAGAWVNVTDNTLRGQLASSTGYQLIPSIQKQRWKDMGDIRGWDAVCDGVSDDITAINNAIADTGGKITIPKDTFVSTHVLFKNISYPTINFTNGAQLKISTAFSFSTAYRGILVFDTCDSPYSNNAAFVGARVDKMSAPEPVQDGDAGIEYILCTGTLKAINPRGKDLKTWGIIHVSCPDADSIIENPVFSNCQVQSGIGGTGYKSLTVINPQMTDIGLYGIEIETLARNVKTTILGGTSVLCQKAVALVHNSDNILVSGHKAIDCKVGFSSTSASPTVAAYQGNGQAFIGCMTTSCGTDFELVYPQDLSVISNTSNRDDVEFFVRTRALDRIVKFISGKPYVGLDSSTDNPNFVVGQLIRMDDGTQFTIATVDAAATTDSDFGYIWGFTTTTTIATTYVRSAIRRYMEISSAKPGVVLYGGGNVVIKDNHFAWATSVIISYGDHANLQWTGNTTYNCASYFTLGSTGSVSGNVYIDKGMNINLGGFGNPNKFASICSASRTLVFTGGTTTVATQKLNAIPIDAGAITQVSCAINSGYTTTGTVSVKVNGTQVVLGGFSGTPARATSSVTPALAVSDAATVQITDTVGDLIATGYAVKLNGIFN